MNFKKIISAAAAAVLMLTAAAVPCKYPTKNVVVSVTANAESAMSVEELKAKFPHGKYWNHVVTEAWQYADNLYNTGDNTFADTVTDHPCATHNGTPAYGSYDCNVFAKAMQCCGFAKKLAYDAYGGADCYQWPQTTDFNSLKPGDVLHYYGQGADEENGHWVFVIGVSGDTITLGECNINGKLCCINWGRTISKSRCTSYKIYSAPSEVSQTKKVVPAKPVLTVKAGTSETDTVLTWGACANADWYDVRLYRQGATESFHDKFGLKALTYSIQLPAGTYYANIASVNNNKKYTFSDNVTFTVTEPPVKGSMKITTAAKTKFECAINGKVESFNVQVTGGALEKAVNIPIDAASASSEYALKDGDYKAVFSAVNSGKSTTLDTVCFTVKGGESWTYVSSMPKDLDESYAVQYKTFEEKIQKTSPGEGWVDEGVAKSTWENSGDQIVTEAPMETSDARVLVKECFYHWCIPGAGAGSEGNYEMRDQFVHYDEIVLPNSSVAVKSTGDDEGHTYYLLTWGAGGSDIYCKSGEQCDGSYGEHDYRCRAWYKHYYYQNRVKVELNKYTRVSEWQDKAASDSGTTYIRYKASLVGDTNNDGNVTIADLTALSQWLLAKDKKMGSWQNADVCADGVIDVYDMVMLRKLIIEKKLVK